MLKTDSIRLGIGGNQPLLVKCMKAREAEISEGKAHDGSLPGSVDAGRREGVLSMKSQRRAAVRRAGAITTVFLQLHLGDPLFDGK